MLEERFEVDTDCDICDYFNLDTEVVTSGALTLKEIAKACSNADVEANSDEDEDEVEERPPVSTPIAIQGFIRLRQYCEENGLDPSLYPALDQIEDFLQKNRTTKMVQPEITEFFPQLAQ